MLHLIQSKAKTTVSPQQLSIVEFPDPEGRWQMWSSRSSWAVLHVQGQPKLHGTHVKQENNSKHNKNYYYMQCNFPGMPHIKTSFFFYLVKRISCYQSVNRGILLIISKQTCLIKQGTVSTFSGSVLLFFRGVLLKTLGFIYLTDAMCLS